MKYTRLPITLVRTDTLEGVQPEETPAYGYYNLYKVIGFYPQIDDDGNEKELITINFEGGLTVADVRLSVQDFLKLLNKTE